MTWARVSSICLRMERAQIQPPVSGRFVREEVVRAIQGASLQELLGEVAGTQRVTQALRRAVRSRRRPADAPRPARGPSPLRRAPQAKKRARHRGEPSMDRRLLKQHSAGLRAEQIPQELNMLAKEFRVRSPRASRPRCSARRGKSERPCTSPPAGQRRMRTPRRSRARSKSMIEARRAKRACQSPTRRLAVPVSRVVDLERRGARHVNARRRQRESLGLARPHYLTPEGDVPKRCPERASNAVRCQPVEVSS